MRDGRVYTKDVMSVPRSRETPRAETSTLFGHLKSAVLAVLSIVSFAASGAASSVSPCYATTIGLSGTFGTIVRRSHQQRIRLQVLKTQSTKKLACRVYPDDGRAHRTPGVLA